MTGIGIVGKSSGEIDPDQSQETLLLDADDAKAVLTGIFDQIELGDSINTRRSDIGHNLLGSGIELGLSPGIDGYFAGSGNSNRDSGFELVGELGLVGSGRLRRDEGGSNFDYGSLGGESCFFGGVDGRISFDRGRFGIFGRDIGFEQIAGCIVDFSLDGGNTVFDCLGHDVGLAVFGEGLGGCLGGNGRQKEEEGSSNDSDQGFETGHRSTLQYGQPGSKVIYNEYMWMSGADTIPAEWLWWILPLAIWDVVWKGIGLWHAARNGQKNWFVALMVLNTAGILPMIYLKWFQKKI